MCYAANAITGCVHSVTSSTIDAILLDYNGYCTNKPWTVWACRCYWFYQCYQSESNENVGNIDYIFLNMVNNLRIYMYNSRSFAEKYTEIHWCIDIPIGINLASSNFCLPTTELWTHPQLHFCTFYFALIIFRSHYWYCFLHNHCIAGLLEEPWNIAQMQSHSEGVWTNYTDLYAAYYGTPNVQSMS